jgi:hypothetical protein
MKLCCTRPECPKRAAILLAQPSQGCGRCDDCGRWSAVRWLLASAELCERCRFARLQLPLPHMDEG